MSSELPELQEYKPPRKPLTSFPCATQLPLVMSAWNLSLIPQQVLFRAETTGQTGVEMEALTAVQVALLTIYDMCKAVDRGMVMSDIKLLEKSGGKSGEWKAS